MRKIKRVLSLSLLIAVFFFILRTALLYWSQIHTDLDKITFQRILLCIIFFLIYYTLRALSWHFILKFIRSFLPIQDSLRIWSLAESTRYIPGNVWSFLGRLVLARKKGIPKSTTTLSMGVEIISMLGVTGLLSLPAAFSAFYSIIYKSSIMLAVAGLFLFGITFFLLRRKKRNTISSTLIKKVSLFNYRFLFPILLLQFLAWISFCTGGLLLVGGVFNLFIGSFFIFSWLIGYISLLTPMGLGVREGALILLLSPYIGIGKATFAALATRILLIASEGLLIGFWLYFERQNQIKRKLSWLLLR